MQLRPHQIKALDVMTKKSKDIVDPIIDSILEIRNMGLEKISKKDMETAKKVLKTEYPELADRVNLVTPGEKEKRLGQAMAAASLPSLA